jgi:hypothetical protein
MTGDRDSRIMASQPNPTGQPNTPNCHCEQLLMSWKWGAVRPGTGDNGEWHDNGTMERRTTTGWTTMPGMKGRQQQQ